ncbi:MAG: cytochrome ubiquinol oxidase subunit II [Betaproteobacteria bacterium]|nr:cytochrome ubiquinol oxidase subunit II [Betaproteobacteria bacterium]
MNRRSATPRVLSRTVISAGRWLVLSAVVPMLAACTGNLHLSFLDPQGPVAAAQRWHFFEVLGIMAVLVAGPIFLLLPFFAWRYRYGNKASRYAPRWEFSRLLEIMAWSGPIVIVVVLSFILWRDTHRLDPYKPLASDQTPLRVQVIGYDWKWLFIYPDQGIASIGMLAMPAGRPVSMQITSATVMQSLFIPALGSQIYAMGGMVTRLNLEADRPGRFLGENTMYNGNGFHQQHFTAAGMTPDDFSAWVQNVRAHGTPLDARTLQLVAGRSTRAALIDALPGKATHDGNLYFTHVSEALFPAVVQATLDGRAQLPRSALAHADPDRPRSADAPHSASASTP